MLKELYLNNIGLQPEHMQLLGQALSNKKSLMISVLDISDNDRIGLDGCQHLANVRNTSLSELMMNRCGVELHAADHIGKMLLYNKYITSVDLSYNNIKDDGVKMLVEHLMSNTTLKRLNLGNNGITNIGANYLSKLFTCNVCTVNRIGLASNPLEDEGGDLILQSITAPMEFVGLADTEMTLCSPSIYMALHKIKFISFTPPDNCDSFSDSLANTTVLEGLVLCNDSDAACNTMITGIRRNKSVKTLYFVNGDLHHPSVINLAEVIKVNKIITAIGIGVDVSAASDYLLLADAVAVNTSIKNLIINVDKYSKHSLNKPQSLQFIKQLKHNHTLELLVLVGIYDYEDGDQFNRDVEMLVEEINYTRQQHGVTTLLYVSMNVDISDCHWEQVNIFITHYKLYMTTYILVLLIQLMYYGDTSVFTRW